MSTAFNKTLLSQLWHRLGYLNLTVGTPIAKFLNYLLILISIFDPGIGISFERNKFREGANHHSKIPTESDKGKDPEVKIRPGPLVHIEKDLGVTEQTQKEAAAKSK